MNRTALVVGINQYPYLKDTPTSRAKHLKNPACDAEEIAHVLKTYGGFDVIRLPSSKINGKFQVDPDGTVETEELETAIEDLFNPKSEKVPSTALLFFAGHGLRKSSRRGTKGFLAASDADPGDNQWGLSLPDLQ